MKVTFVARILGELRKVKRCCSNFGFLSGLRIYFQLLCNVEKIYIGANKKLPNWDGYLYFRKGSTDKYVFDQVFLNLEYRLPSFPQSRSLIQRYEELIKSNKSPLIVDCGANTGFSSIFFKLLFPNATILAIEPNSDNFRILLKNLGGIKDLNTIQGAVYSETKELKLIDPGKGQWGFRVQEFAGQDRAESVQAFSMNDLLKEQLNTRPDMVPFICKIDIEGAEKQLFSENTEWVNLFKLITIEIHDRQIPNQGISAPFFRTCAFLNRDILFQGENVFSFASN